MKTLFPLLLTTLGLLTATARAQVVDRVHPEPAPFTHVSTKVTPGNNFRMQVDIVVATKPDATVAAVEGVCVYQIAGRRTEAPAVKTVNEGGGRWTVGFIVPKNDSYYVEIYSVKSGPPDPKSKTKKPAKIKSTALLVEVKI